MLKNIGKTIRVLAIVLAALSFLGFAALGALMLIATLDGGISDELETAGMQAAIICFVLAVLTPFLNLILYGFGTLITTVQAQAEDSRKTREMLQSALSDGMLSEEIARKSAQAQAKLLAHVAAQTPTPEKTAPKASRAPVQRPVKEIPEAPAKKKAPTAPPVREESPAPAFIPTVQPSAKDAQPAPAFIPAAPAPAPFRAPTPVIPTESADLLRPFSNDEETF